MLQVCTKVVLPVESSTSKRRRFRGFHCIAFFRYSFAPLRFVVGSSLIKGVVRKCLVIEN